MPLDFYGVFKIYSTLPGLGHQKIYTQEHMLSGQPGRKMVLVYTRSLTRSAFTPQGCIGPRTICLTSLCNRRCSWSSSL